MLGRFDSPGGPGECEILRMSFSLQANWLDQSLYLWARPATDGQPAAAPADLRAVAGEVCSDCLLASAVAEATLPIRLPGSDANPTHVPALRLGPAEAIDFLTS